MQNKHNENYYIYHKDEQKNRLSDIYGKEFRVKDKSNNTMSFKQFQLIMLHSVNVNNSLSEYLTESDRYTILNNSDQLVTISGNTVKGLYVEIN